MIARRRIVSVILAMFAFALAPAKAQVAPGIVVTSPHVWQPGGSAPPHGV